jgi:hypothetical protein
MVCSLLTAAVLVNIVLTFMMSGICLIKDDDQILYPVPVDR